MSGWVKVCGLTTPDAVAAAIEAGVDAVGFVFAESPRAVSVDAAVLLAGLARGHARVVAVMRHPAPELAHEVQARVAPDVLQTDVGDYDTFDLLPGVMALPVYRDHDVSDPDILPRQLLFEGRNSGSGETADWGLAARVAHGRELVLAGGLNADNVGQAIADVAPWGVDVSSGVESAPGQKDADKIMTFVRTARAAFA
ncbi:MAG: phosphoribosylanthranilate isomerase [Pseudomonadota bacterium]